MKVSIVLVTYNEEKNIKECLDSLARINYPKKDYEILVVDGGSKDKTLDIVEKFQKKYKNIRVEKDSIGYIATSRNVGFKKAKYSYIAYTNAGCTVPRNWLKKLTSAYEKLSKKHEKLAGVGGANKPQKYSDKFARSYSIAQNTSLGSLGSAQAKAFTEPTEVKSISCCNALYNRKALIDAGGFPGKRRKEAEDWELNYKLRKKGYKVMVVPKLFVWKKLRKTPYKFFKHMFLYGDCRILAMKRYPETVKSVYILPLLFLIAIISSIFSFLHWIFLIPLLYFPFIFIYSAIAAMKNGKAHLIGHVLLIFLLMHFGYALGELTGIFRGRS